MPCFAHVLRPGSLRWHELVGWTLPIVPVGFSAISHQFLTAYDGATGLLSAAQPAFTDISGIAPAQIGTGTPSANTTATGAGPPGVTLPDHRSLEKLRVDSLNR